jgi:hypothetical protein
LPRTTAIGATRRRESCEAATTRRESTPGLHLRDWHPSIALNPDVRQNRRLIDRCLFGEMPEG